jgi:fumarate hydratase subunit beta
VRITKKVRLPISDTDLKSLKAGDRLSLSGHLYVARDAAHRKIFEAMDAGKPLPFPLEGETVFYMGPAPAKPGQIIGSAGPTTSGRMDRYTPRLLAAGLKVMVGKGSRSVEVRDSIRKYHAVYLAAIGGAGALISKSVIKCDIVAYPEFGPEAVIWLEVKDFPAVVINDIYGGDAYAEGQADYRRMDT